MEEVDKEISEMKLSLNSRARIVAESYLVAVRLFLLVYILTHSSLAVQHLIVILTFHALYRNKYYKFGLTQYCIFQLAWLINGNARQRTNRRLGDAL